MLLFLVVIHTVLIVLCNYFVQFSFDSEYGSFSLAMLLYPCIVILSDLTTRIMGPIHAQRVIFFSWFPALLLSLVITESRIAAASVCVYVCSQLLDIYLFSSIRSQLESDFKQQSKLWYYPPMMSAIVSQCLDTYLFYALAFSGSNDLWMRQNWVHIATADYVFKIFVVFIFLLPCYRVCLQALLSYLDLPDSRTYLPINPERVI
ncbi:MAG: hypothetical protein CMF46_00190 [Legionellales bacterium]|nr:hypothetical protein [Legionellales bacterium]